MPGQTIPLKDAKDMTSLYRNNINTILKETYQDQNILGYCETFDREPFEKLLNLPNCTAVRIYFGMNLNLQVRAIIVGVDANNNDILPSESNSMTVEEEDPPIIETGRPCPDLCPSVLL